MKLLVNIINAIVLDSGCEAESVVDDLLFTDNLGLLLLFMVSYAGIALASFQYLFLGRKCQELVDPPGAFEQQNDGSHCGVLHAQDPAYLVRGHPMLLIQVQDIDPLFET